MESRKYQLQKQIVEALKSNDSDLYSLLSSQWAHRFGVESLDELKNLDLDKSSQKPINLDNQKIDKSKETSYEHEEALNTKGDDGQEKSINNNEFQSIKDDNEKLLKAKSYEIVEKEKIANKKINTLKENKIRTKVEALLPLPPKPKYSYLKKWLLRK